MDGSNARRVLQEALGRLSQSGRFTPADSQRLRRLFPHEAWRDISLDHPADLFGSWTDLPPSAQRAMRLCVETSISKWMNLQPTGSFWTGLIRGARELDRYLEGREPWSHVRPQLVTWSERLHGGPRRLRRWADETLARRRWTGSRPALLGDLLSVLGRDPHWLLADFVDGVRVDPRARGFFRDRGKNTTTGYHLGLDLIPTARGYCCTEANLWPTIWDDQRHLQDGNPLVEGVVAAARELKASRLVWIEGERYPMKTWMLEALHGHTRELGMQLDVLEDPCMPARRAPLRDVPLPRSWLTRIPGLKNALVVRRNDFRVGSDYVVSNKEPFIRGLQGTLGAEVKPDTFVLPLTRKPPPVVRPHHPGVPNLVYKYPDAMAGQGIFFLRVRESGEAIRIARRLDRETGEPPGLFQEFVLSELSGGRRTCDIRSNILLTPSGPRFLGALRREAPEDLPGHVPEGLVETRKAYTPNVHQGGRLSALAPDQVTEVEQVSLAIGQALKNVLRATFETER